MKSNETISIPLIPHILCPYWRYGRYSLYRPYRRYWRYALNPHPTIPFVNPLIRKSVNPLTIGAICAIGATTIIPPIAYRPYRRYGRYWRYSPYSP